jgi:hypothetical protein
MESKYYAPKGGFTKGGYIKSEGGIFYGFFANMEGFVYHDPWLINYIKRSIKCGAYEEIPDPTKLTIICPECRGAGGFGPKGPSVKCPICEGEGVIELNKKDLPRQFIAINNAYEAWRREGDFFSSSDLSGGELEICRRIDSEFNAILLSMVLKIKKIN